MTENFIVENQEIDYYISPLNGLWMWFKLQRVIKSGKATSMTYNNLAEICQWYGFYKKARKYVLKALRMNKNNALAYITLGNLKDFDAGKKYFLKALKIGSRYDYQALAYLAVYERDNYKESVVYYKRFFECQSDDAGYVYWRALLNVYFFNIGAAVKDLPLLFKKIINERLYIPISSMGVLLFAILWSGALELCFRENIAAARAIILLNAGREKEAVDMIFNVISKSKNKKTIENCYYLLLDFFFDRKEYKKCIDVVNRILIKEKFEGAFRYKIRSYVELEEYDKAIELMKTIKENYNINYSIWCDFDIGVTYYRMKDYDNALKYFNRHIISNQDPKALLYKGVCLEETDCYEDALKAYQQSLEYKPDDCCYYRIANLYYRMNDYEEALENINRSLMLRKDSYNYNLKGDILTSLKRIKEARACYKKAEGLE